MGLIEWVEDHLDPRNLAIRPSGNRVRTGRATHPAPRRKKTERRPPSHRPYSEGFVTGHPTPPPKHAPPRPYEHGYVGGPAGLAPSGPSVSDLIGSTLAEYSALLDRMHPAAFDEAPYLTAIAQSHATADKAVPVIEGAYNRAEGDITSSVNQALAAQAAAQQAYQGDVDTQLASLQKMGTGAGRLVGAYGGDAAAVQGAGSSAQSAGGLVQAIAADQAAGATAAQNIAQQQGSRAVETAVGGEAASLSENQNNLSKILDAIGLKRVGDKASYDQAAASFDAEKAMKLWEFENTLRSNAAEQAREDEKEQYNRAKDDRDFALKVATAGGKGADAQKLSGKDFFNLNIAPTLGPNEQAIFSHIVDNTKSLSAARQLVRAAADDIQGGKYEDDTGEVVTHVGVDPAKIAKWLDLYYNPLKQSADDWGSVNIQRGTFGHLPGGDRRRPTRHNTDTSNTNGWGSIAHQASRLGKVAAAVRTWPF